MGAPTQEVAPTYPHVVWHTMQPPCQLSSRSWRGTRGANALSALGEAWPLLGRIGLKLPTLALQAGFQVAQGFLKWGVHTGCSLMGKAVSNADSQPQAAAQVAACSQHREQAVRE